MARDLRAVLVDDDAQRAPAFRATWKGILTQIFAHADVALVNDVDATDEILKGRPHIVILDNVFPDQKRRREVPNRGLDFIVSHKVLYPDTLFILYTGNTFQVDALGNKFPNPDLIVTKTSLANVAYQTYIAKCISEKLQRIPVPDLMFPDARDSADVDRFRDDLHSIIEQCLLVVQDRPAGDYVRQVNLTRMGGGYSGSYVYLATIFGSDRHQNLPFALKITEGSGISEEVNRYNTFARLQMPHDMRVDLLGAGRTGRYSGALYAFAFGKIGGISSATDRI